MTISATSVGEEHVAGDLLRRQVEAGSPVPLAELDRQRQADMAETDDGDGQ